jgi:hypothetical protein
MSASRKRILNRLFAEAFSTGSNKSGAKRAVRRRRLVPLEETGSKIKDADSLLLLVGLTVVVHIEQSTLQPL